MMWFSVDHQLWPSVKYGLCCSMATLSELELVLLPFYGAMLLLGGIVRTAPKGIRQLDQGFYGADLPHPGVEAIVEQSNKLHMHYGCRTALGGLIGDVVPTSKTFLCQLRTHGDHQLAEASMGEA
jgi:hypothetical protein